MCVCVSAWENYDVRHKTTRGHANRLDGADYLITSIVSIHVHGKPGVTGYHYTDF